MKLCLVNPPEINGYVSDRDKAGGIGVAKPFHASVVAKYLPPTPPMDLLYAAAIAEKEQVALRVVDCIGNRWGQQELYREVEAEKPTHIGVRVSMPSLDEDLVQVNRLKEKFPEAKVFIFGHATQTTYTTWLKASKADAVFYGEVEALMMPYLRGEESKNVLTPQGATTACFNWAYVENLDELPFPAWHRIDFKQYTLSQKVEDFVFYILTSRGCPKGCSMCPYYIHQGKQWRFRSVDNIMAELDYLRGLGAVKLQTRDPNISWRKKHLLEIASRLAGETQFQITTETDLEVLNEQDLVALRSAGFVRILTGVESVDESVIKDIGQNTNALKRSLDNMVLCEKLGMKVTGFFIIGSLHETWKSVRSTLATAKALPCDYSISLMTPYFGTEMREEFIKAGYYKEATTFKQYNGYSGLVRTTGLTFEEVELAYAWGAAELELVNRQRLLAKATGLEKAKQALRVLVQQARVSSLRSKTAGKQDPPTTPELPTAAAA